MKKKAASLTGVVATKVGKQCNLADVAFVEGRFLEAADNFKTAWNMLPAPREQWESGREIVKCWGEAYLAAGELEKALDAFETAKKYKGADEDETLAILLAQAKKSVTPKPKAKPKKKKKKVSAVADRSRARAPKKAKARSRRPSRPASASSRKAPRGK